MAKPGDKSGLAEDGAKAVYDRLVNDRAPYITRAERNAQYTNPAYFPKSSDNGSTDYPTPYQSVGARGVNNLASKLLLAQLPVGEPFFKLAINEFALKSIQAPEIVQQAEIGLGLTERVLMRFLEGANYRPTVFELMKQLIVAGNGLLYMPPGEKAVKLYRLNAYVIERDTTGNVIQGVTRDEIAFVALPEDIKNSLGTGKDYKPADKVEIFTHFYKDEESDTWLAYQEVEGEIVQGSESTYPKLGCPWVAIRMFKIDGESYGRSFVEEYVGDLVSLENLSESIVQFAQAASKVLFLVNPGGQTSIRRLVKSRNGSFVPGKLADVEVFQMNKYADFQVAKATADGIEQRLSYAFLLNSAVQRNGERVTAEEIRFVANELEATLGGVYSVLSNEFQLPVVQRLLLELQATKQIPELPKEAVEPQIVTGLDAIGRGQDLAKLETFIQGGQYAFQFAQGDVNWSNYLLRVASAAGLDPEGLLLTPQERQQRQMMDAQGVAIQQAGAAAGAAAGQAAGMAATANTDAMAQMAQQYNPPQ